MDGHHLDDFSIHVRHTLQEYGSELALAEPKTKQSRRRIDLPAFVAAELREHRKRMMAEGHSGPWVFCDTAGGPLRKSNLVRREFRPLLKADGLPLIRFHDPRHALLGEGVHPKIVQERLGAFADRHYARHLLTRLAIDAAGRRSASRRPPVTGKNMS